MNGRYERQTVLGLLLDHVIDTSLARCCGKARRFSRMGAARIVSLTELVRCLGRHFHYFTSNRVARNDNAGAELLPTNNVGMYGVTPRHLLTIHANALRNLDNLR